MSVRAHLATLPGMAALRQRLRETPPTANDYHGPILDPAEGNDLIRRALMSDAPYLAARCGGPETQCVTHYMRYRGGPRIRPYKRHLRHLMSNNVGFFPTSDACLDQFAEVYIDAISQADAMGVWLNVGENQILREHCPQAALMRPRAVEPFYHQNPWSEMLGGRRVVVVHPFADSINAQFRTNRERLFVDPGVLPAFELTTIKAVQSLAGEPTEFADWFHALDWMTGQMDALDYDVAIVGAGSYGLPLAAHAKRSGRQAVHVGGAVQILFGIMGRRWDGHEISGFYNEHWVRPLPSEVPRAAGKVEGGCYW